MICHTVSSRRLPHSSASTSCVSAALFQVYSISAVSAYLVYQYSWFLNAPTCALLDVYNCNKVIRVSQLGFVAEQRLSLFSSLYKVAYMQKAL